MAGKEASKVGRVDVHMAKDRDEQALDKENTLRLDKPSTDANHYVILHKA